VEALSLKSLAGHRRVYDQLDWWTLDEVADQVISVRGNTAALCVLKSDDANGAAWLRWCAVKDGEMPTLHLRELFFRVAQNLKSQAVDQIWCVCERSHWLRTFLTDNGFKLRDCVVTMELRDSTTIKSLGVPPFMIRPVAENELPALHQFDAAVFAAPWQYSREMLKRALAQTALFTVAEFEGRPVAYQCAAMQNQHAHIIRLVVHPDFQKQGYGRGLLSDAVRTLRNKGADRITLNTPASNRDSQRLYQSLGFSPLSDIADVLCKTL
jgi:ribosomal-protein-alanine N-acetyltransferase